MNDFHGVVAAETLPGDTAWILGRAGLKSWRFHHLAVDQPWFWPARASQSASPLVDLRGGFECYVRERHRHHRRTFHDLQRRARQLAQHRGPLRFEFDVRDHCLLDRLVAWKRDQYQRTAVVDVFGFAWTRELLETLHAHRTPRFAGVLSALYAGHEPVALHFGLRTERVLHCWFPAYDVSVARWSPGWQLFLRLIEAAAHAGLERVDFGKGREGFKRKLANAETVVAEGVAGESRASRQLRKQWHWAREKLQTSRLHGRLQRPLRWAARVVHPQRGAASFQLPPAHPPHAHPSASESIPGSS